MAKKKKKAKKKEWKKSERILKLTVDLETGASYLRIKEGEYAGTVSVRDVINVDVDKAGNVLGIEILQ